MGFGLVAELHMGLYTTGLEHNGTGLGHNGTGLGYNGTELEHDGTGTHKDLNRDIFRPSVSQPCMNGIQRAWETK